MAWNYVVNSRWTWGREMGDGRQGLGDNEQPMVIDESLSIVYRPSVVGEEVLI
jgi:hypothetical protein